MSIVTDKPLETTRAIVDETLTKAQTAGYRTEQLGRLRFVLAKAITEAVDRVGLNQVTGRPDSDKSKRAMDLLRLQTDLKGTSPAEVTAFKKAGNDELLSAIDKGNEIYVSFALLAGADPNFLVNGISPVHAAIAKDRAPIVELLLASQADINLAGKNGIRPIHLAAAFGSTQLLQAVLSKGPDLNVKNDDGDTALTLATAKNKFDNVALLKESGAK